MLSKQGIYKAFHLFLKEILLLKTYLHFFFLFIILACGCSGNKKQGSESDVIMEDKAVDYAARGLENLNASGKMKDILCQCWENKEDAESAKGFDAASNIDVVFRGYCLFADGSMVKDPRGVMQPGKWTLNDAVKPITLNFELKNSGSETRQLAYLMPYNLKLAAQVGTGNEISEYGSEALRELEPTKDPFHFSNNEWRIKPTSAETSAQIKQRLKDCIHFFILFYDQRIAAASDEVSFVGLPSPFKWYGGAIYIQNKKEVQDKWVNTYYNREQAMKAYALADELIGLKYNWPKEGNWLNKNVAVLRQMEIKLDSL